MMPQHITPAGHFVHIPMGTNGDFPATFEAHWEEFFSWWRLSVAGCIAATILSRILLPLLVPASWAAMVKDSPWKATTVPKNVAEWWPAVVVFPLAVHPVRVLTTAALAEPAMALYLPAPSGMWCATGAAVGYMSFDCFMLLVFHRSMILSMKLPMYMQIWGHHLLSMIIWPLGLHTSVANVFIAWFLLSEGSNLFLNCRTLLIKFNAGSGMKFSVSTGLFSLSFIALRILPMPLFLAFWSRIDYSHTTWFTWSMTVGFTPLPSLLNLYWLYLMVGMATKKKKK